MKSHVTIHFALFFGCALVLWADSAEFSLSDVRIEMPDPAHFDSETRIKRCTGLLSQDLLPVERFMVHSELVGLFYGKQDYSGTVDNATQAIEMAEKQEAALPGYFRALYLQNLRYLYMIAELKQKPIEEVHSAYMNLYNCFQRNPVWKDKHQGEYLAVLVGLECYATNKDEQRMYQDRIILEVPSANTAPFWIAKRYADDVNKSPQLVCDRIKMVLDQYQEYPLAVCLYSMLGGTYLKMGRMEEAIAAFEDGVSHYDKLYNRLPDGERKSLLNDLMVRQSVRSMHLRCMELYFVLGDVKAAERHFGILNSTASDENERGMVVTTWDRLQGSLDTGTMGKRGRNR